jgi:hypothetical protein
MPSCPECHEPFVHGQIICSHCWADLDEPKTLEKTQYLPVLGVQQGLVHVEPTITLHVIEVDKTSFLEGTFVAVLPIGRLEVPVRIGRMDLSQRPPIVPELDLGSMLTDVQPGLRPVVSRLHAALQLDKGRPAIKALVDTGTIWTRHTGRDRLSPVPPNEVRPLEDRDVILLGYPRSRHVTLRVVFS